MNLSQYISVVFMLLTVNGWNQNLSNKFECPNSIQLLNTYNETPIIELNTNVTSDSILAKAGSKGFCINIQYKQQSFNLHLNGKQESFNDSIIYCGIRNDKTILVNANDQILFGANMVSLDTLKSEIRNYYKAVGNSKINSPENLKQVSWSIKWQKGCSTQLIESILIIISYSYLEALEYHKNVIICDLSEQDVESIKANYPLKIKFLGHRVRPDLEEIIIIKDTEIENNR